MIGSQVGPVSDALGALSAGRGWQANYVDRALKAVHQIAVYRIHAGQIFPTANQGKRPRPRKLHR
jgi:hypothetical protein